MNVLIYVTSLLLVFFFLEEIVKTLLTIKGTRHAKKKNSVEVQNK